MQESQYCTQNGLAREWDAVVIGGGHNGLVAAAYLARAGRSVAVLERRHVLGGAAVTEELLPGFKYSRCSYLQSLLRPSIIRDLNLKEHGLRLLPRNPSSFTPLLDGRSLLMGPDPQLNYDEIAKFSAADAQNFPKYEAQLERIVACLEPLLDQLPPDPSPRAKASTLRMRLQEAVDRAMTVSGLVRRAAALHDGDLTAMVQLLLSPAARVLDKWFESDVLKATLATDAVIGAMVSPNTPGSGYVLLHHVMGETNGHRGVWSYVSLPFHAPLNLKNYD
eukprot:jgi/Chlat1/7008/Chrsp56S06691